MWCLILVPPAERSRWFGEWSWIYYSRIWDKKLENTSPLISVLLITAKYSSEANIINKCTDAANVFLLIYFNVNVAIVCYQKLTTCSMYDYSSIFGFLWKWPCSLYEYIDVPNRIIHFLHVYIAQFVKDAYMIVLSSFTVMTSLTQR